MLLDRGKGSDRGSRGGDDDAKDDRDAKGRNEMTDAVLGGDDDDDGSHIFFFESPVFPKAGVEFVLNHLCGNV